MESSGYSSPRSDVFPAGLRVLVVDDDPTWLKILEKMLKKCSYEVITCGLAREALDLIREKKDGFDIVISDVNMPDMDGFKLLEHVGLEMDLPVIMMSVDGETSRVMKGVQHGACDYLLKPIRMKELRNIWQHVLRKRIHEVRDIESHEGLEEIQLLRNGSDYLEDGYLPYANDLTSGKKRKDFENKHDGREYNDPSSAKKTRVVWTVDLHQKFVKAVNQIGLEKVGPKKILDLMGVPWLTRENVASHLQKYRLYLSRLQKDKQHVDLASKEHVGNHCPQSLTNQQQRDFTNGNYSSFTSSTTMHNIDFKIQEDDMKCTVPKAVEEPKKASNLNNPDPWKNSISRTSFTPFFGQCDGEVNFASPIPKLSSWDAEVQLQLEPDSRQQFEHSGFNLQSIPTVQPSIKFECPQLGPCIKSKPSRINRDIEAGEKLKPSHFNSRSHSIGQLHPKISTADLFSILSESQITGQGLKPQPGILWNIKNQSLEQIPMTREDSVQQVVNSATSVTAFGFWDETPPQRCLLQSDFQPIGIGLENIESLDYTDPKVIAEVPDYSYDSVKFDYEYPLDSMEYSVIDHGVFIM